MTVITLYDLENSRGRRVQWVLQELGLQYKRELYHRNEDSQAPVEFKNIFPTGKFPAIKDDDNLIGESGFIVTYLIQKYGANTDLLGANEKEKIEVGYGVTASESTLQIYQMMLMLHQKARAKMPWAISGVGNKVLNSIDEKYPLPGLEACLDELEAKVKANGGFYSGGHLTAADMMYEFILPKIRERAYFKDFDQRWPAVLEYSKRITELCDKTLAAKKDLCLETVDHK